MNFIKEYWTQIIFFISMVGIIKAFIEATKCSLRNDMLMIWDICSPKGKISKYQLETFMESADLYFKLGGDGFIHTIYDKIQKFEIINEKIN